MWSATKRASARSRTIEAEVRFLRDADVRPRIDDEDPSRTLLPLASHTILFHDRRSGDEPASLDREGFAILPHRSEASDFGDERQRAIYRAEVEELIRELTGAERVFVSPSLVLRSTDHAHPPVGVITDRVAGLVHADRTRRSVMIEAGWAAQHAGVDTLPPGRIVSYNLWRALSPPPQDFPLALCDLRTVREDHLVTAVSAGNPANRGLELEFVLSLFDPRQRWCYFSNLTREELLVFQQFDTAMTGPSGCLHTAFRDPSCPTTAPTRLSVEARAYALFP